MEKARGLVRLDQAKDRRRPIGVVTFALVLYALLLAFLSALGREANAIQSDGALVAAQSRRPRVSDERTPRVIVADETTPRVRVANARILFLTGTTVDPGRDFNPNTAPDNDTAGPFFVVKGDVTSVGDRPVAGTFICRGVVFTGKRPPQRGGITQVNQSFDIAGLGILFGEAIELGTQPTAHAVIGVTGAFERMLGT